MNVGQKKSTLNFVKDTFVELKSLKSVKNALKVLIANIIATAIGFIGSLIIQKNLALDLLGILAVYSNLTALLTGVILGCLNTIFIRYVSMYFDKQAGIAKYLSNRILRFEIIIGFIVLIIGLLFAPVINDIFFHKTELINFIRLSSLAVLLTIISSYLQTFFQIKQSYNIYSIIIVSQGILSTLAVILLYIWKILTPLHVVIVNIITICIVIIISYIIYRYQSFSKLKESIPPPNIFHEIFHYSKWILIMTFSSYIFLRVDIFLLTSLSNLREVALYSFAYSLYAPFLLILGAMNTILFPILSRLKSREDFISIKKKIFKLSLIVVLLAIPLMILITPLIKFIFQDKFNDSIPILYIMYFGLIFSIILNPINSILLVIKKEKLMALVTFIELIVCVIGNLVFIPMFGMKGAAIVTTTTVIFANIINYYFVGRSLKKLETNKVF